MVLFIYLSKPARICVYKTRICFHPHCFWSPSNLFVFFLFSLKHFHAYPSVSRFPCTRLETILCSWRLKSAPTSNLDWSASWPCASPSCFPKRNQTFVRCSNPYPPLNDTLPLKGSRPKAENIFPLYENIVIFQEEKFRLIKTPYKGLWGLLAVPYLRGGGSPGIMWGPKYFFFFGQPRVRFR